jgi:hypothetical protein
MEPNNITMVGWVDQTLEQLLTKNTSSLNSRLQIYGFSNSKQWITRLNLNIYALQQTFITREINTITQ